MTTDNKNEETHSFIAKGTRRRRSYKRCKLTGGNERTPVVNITNGMLIYITSARVYNNNCESKCICVQCSHTNIKLYGVYLLVHPREVNDKSNAREFKDTNSKDAYLLLL